MTTSSVASCSAAQHFTVEQLVQIDAGDAGLAAQDQAALVGAAALGDHRIRQTEKAVLPDGLELVEIGTHHIGFHCKLGGRSKKDDLDDVIVLPDLLGGGNAVFGRHDDIQKQDIVPGALFDLGQQIQRAAKGCALDLDTALGAIFFQQGRELVQNCLVIVAEGDLDHNGFNTSFVRVSQKLQLGLAHAVGLQHIVVVVQHHKVGILADLDGTLAVIQMQAARRVDGAGVQCIVEGHHGLLHQNAQALVDVQSGTGQRAVVQMGTAVRVDGDMVAAKDVLAANGPWLF